MGCFGLATSCSDMHYVHYVHYIKLHYMQYIVLLQLRRSVRIFFAYTWWRRYFLAQHPEAEARLCDELDALGLLATLGRPSPRPLVYEDLAKLTWLGCIIKVGSVCLR